MLKGFQELEVWQKAHSLVLEIYRVTENFPDRERYGITSQLRRAAFSVPANIAEGFGRKTTKEYLHFLAISNGSLEEVRYFLLLSRDLTLLAAPDYRILEDKAVSIAQMLAALTRSLRNRIGVTSNTRTTGREARTSGGKSRTALRKR